MTRVGAGGVAISFLQTTTRFEREYRKLDATIKDRVDEKLPLLLANPRPPGLRFEKLKGYKRPDIFTIHITGNYKLSFEIDGTTAVLRSIACHNDIDRSP